MNIAVVGAGIGGLAVAAFLGQSGHAVTVFDQFAAPAPVGSGLVVQPVGQVVLAALGQLAPATAMGNRIDQMIGVEADSGKKVLNVTYGGPQTPRFGLAMHRAGLFDVVYAAAQDAGCKLVASATVTHSDLVDGQRYLGVANHGRMGPFDLVIDASGAGSPLSRVISRPLPYGALWGTVDTPHNHAIPRDTLMQCYRKASTMVGILPVGYLPGGGTRNSPHKTAVFWSLRTDGLKNWHAAGFEHWRQQAGDLWTEFAPFADQLRGAEDFMMARYTHGTLRNPVEDRLVFIGDAAHQTSPQLGQGANMALLDALVLADCLRRLDPDQALQDYARTRRWHVRIYQMFSALFTPFYQSDSRILPLIRDHLLTPVSEIPVARNILRRLVSGEIVPTGWLVQNGLERLYDEP